MPPDIKVILRQSLLEEQGYLCAYCMSKICDKVKIEHYEPRNPQNVDHIKLPTGATARYTRRITTISITIKFDAQP